MKIFLGIGVLVLGSVAAHAQLKIDSAQQEMENRLQLAVELDGQKELIVKRSVDEQAGTFNRTFYTGLLNYYWQPGAASSSIVGSGYATTANGGHISAVTACLYSESSFSRDFRATASVSQGGTTLQSVTFTTSFPPLQNHCHVLTGFNVNVQPGEFQVSLAYDEFNADNIFAGIPTTDSGQTFDIAINSQRPPVGSGSQGPVPMKGIGLGYQITENDAPPPLSCVPSANVMCLNNGRFKVEATYQTSAGSGSAKPVRLTDDSGYLWFFGANNIEAVVKVLNACGVNNRYWVFAAGLTNQGVDITVTDAHNPAITKHYTNPLGRTFVTVTDTDGLASCP